MRNIFLIFLFTFAAVLLSKAAVFETQIEQATSDKDGAYAQFRLWLPAGSHPNRLIVLIWGSQQCSLDVIGDPGWQALAKSMDCGLLTCFFAPQASTNHWDHAAEGSGQALLDALQTFTQMSGEPQLANARLYLVGDSQGGQFSFSFASWKPAQVLGFVSVKGGRHEATSWEQAASVPGLFCMGALDVSFRVKNITQTFITGRALGAPWCVAIEKQGKHEAESCAPLVFDFLQELSKSSRDTAWSPSPPVSEDGGQTFNVANLSWFPSLRFKEELEDFEKGKLAPMSPTLSFESKLPPKMGSSIPASCELTSINSGEQSQLVTLQVVPDTPHQWDGVNILDCPYLSDTKVKALSPQGLSLSFRLNTIGLPLGRFSGVVPLRFEREGKPILGALNVPLTADVVGDVMADPAFIYLGQVRQNDPVFVRIEINSKTKAPIRLLSCQTPQGVKQVSSARSGTTFILTFLFTPAAGNPGDTLTGTITLQLETAKKWVLRVPYVGSYGPEP